MAVLLKYGAASLGAEKSAGSAKQWRDPESADVAAAGHEAAYFQLLVPL